jgi:hypothetical protein
VKGGVPVERDEVRVHDQNRRSGRERRADAGESAVGARPTRLARGRPFAFAGIRGFRLRAPAL